MTFVEANRCLIFSHDSSNVFLVFLIYSVEFSISETISIYVNVILEFWPCAHKFHFDRLYILYYNYVFNNVQWSLDDLQLCVWVSVVNNDFLYTVYIQFMPVWLTIYRDSVFHNSQSKAVQESTNIWTTILFDRYIEKLQPIHKFRLSLYCFVFQFAKF